MPAKSSGSPQRRIGTRTLHHDEAIEPAHTAEMAQLIPGAVAGLGAIGPVMLDPELERPRRIAWSLGLFLVTAVAWMATFHGWWIV